MRAWRAFHPETMAPGDRVCLGSGESHHITRVLRLGAGAAIQVFDGRGHEWESRIESANSAGVQLRIGRPVTEPVEPATRLILVQSVCRADRCEWVLQKGTELGVAEFHLAETVHSEKLRWTPSRRARWERILLEACKQSGRRQLPILRGPEPLDQVAGQSDRTRETALVLDPRETVRNVAAATGLSGTGPVRLLVGPESGLEDREIDELQARGWLAVGMGPRILRTETAGLAAATMILAARGDLGP